jgi:hypothetical protein
VNGYRFGAHTARAPRDAAASRACHFRATWKKISLRSAATTRFRWRKVCPLTFAPAGCTAASAALTDPPAARASAASAPHVEALFEPPPALPTRAALHRSVGRSHRPTSG